MYSMYRHLYSRYNPLIIALVNTSVRMHCTGLTSIFRVILYIYIIYLGLSFNLSPICIKPHVHLTVQIITAVVFV